MKRGGPLKRSPLSRGTSKLTTSKPLRAKSAMKRGDSQLARASKPIRARSKTNSNPRPATGEAALCLGQACYLLVPGVAAHPVDTVVPCHSNQIAHGKGKGIKAHDEFTVPGCMHCHHAIDQSGQFSREEKFALWDAAYARWQPVREQLKGQP